MAVVVRGRGHCTERPKLDRRANRFSTARKRFLRITAKIRQVNAKMVQSLAHNLGRYLLFYFNFLKAGRQAAPEPLGRTAGVGVDISKYDRIGRKLQYNIENDNQENNKKRVNASSLSNDL